MDKYPETDPLHWAVPERPFERQILYSRTSKSHRIDHLSNGEQNYNKEQRWFPENDIPNTADHTFGSVEYGNHYCDSSLNISEKHSLSRVSFSSMDDVRVFYPSLPEIKQPTGNRPRKLTIEDNILKIGETEMYRGRLGKRVDVMSRISDVSSQSSTPSPVTSPNIIQSTDRNVNDTNNKISREILLSQIADGTSDQLSALRRVPYLLRDETGKQKTTSGCCVASGTSVCGVYSQRERIEQILSRKPRRNSIKETTFCVLPIMSDNRKVKTTKLKAVRGMQLPAIGQSVACARCQETTFGLGEPNPCFSYLPKPPTTCHSEGRTNNRRKYKDTVY